MAPASDNPLIVAQSVRVLFAEDDDGVATIFELVMRQAGYIVDRVVDGSAALERISADIFRYDVLLTDHQMLPVNGLQLVARLYGTAFSGAIIVHSSPLSEINERAYRLLRAQHILSKPVSGSVLLDAIRQAIEPEHFCVRESGSESQPQG